MTSSRFAITTYCTLHNVERSFVFHLQEEGLISIISADDEEYIDEEQLQELEMYTRLHHELGINPEGLDAIRHLKLKINALQAELQMLRNRLHFYEGRKSGTDF